MQRFEDNALLRGEGQFTDDIANHYSGNSASNTLTMVVLRSPVAHGTITRLDTKIAENMPGVAAVLTASDDDIAAIKPMKCRASVSGSQLHEPDRPVLAKDRVMHVGEAVAAVVASTLHQAQDAAEAIELEIDSLPAVANVEESQSAGPLWPGIDANRAFSWETGNGEDTTDLFTQAHHITRLTVKHPRVCISPVEPRAVLAEYDEHLHQYTLTTASQGVISLQRSLSAFMGIEKSQLRVVTKDTGGSFAVKIWPYAEHILALIAARKTGCAIKWVSTRTEALQTDAMGRGRVDHAELALDEKGNFLAFRINALADMGAYLNAVAPAVATSGAVRVFGQAYRIPGLHYRVQGLYTNTMTTDAYRGAGKPESSSTLERIIDVAASELKIDPLKLRLQNLVRPADLPYQTPMNESYDAGDFPALATQLTEAADLENYEERRQQSLDNGKYRGLSVAFYLHATGGSTDERSEVRAMADGTVRVRTGIQDNGQGHKTVLAIVAAEALEIPVESVVVEQGDTGFLAKGGGTGGSNLIAVAANTIHRAANTMIDNARALAGDHLEVGIDDIEYSKGSFSVVGTDYTVSLSQLAEARVAVTSDSASDSTPALASANTETDANTAAANAESASERINDCVGIEEFEGIHTTFPCGACACEVEVDPDTGVVTVDRYSSIDDVGRAINATTTIGQIHGGVAQAAGEVLMEQAWYDDNGQLLSGSLMDYRLPRAADLPALNTSLTRTASPNSLLDAKGVGELSSIGAPGPIANAVMNAVAPFAIRHLDKPITPQKIWHALHSEGNST
jgi:carbon-monoxide dehydrogenase large subunit